MPSSPRTRPPSWRAFLTGVLLGLAVLMALGVAIAAPVDPAPFDALLKVHVRDGIVDYPAFQDDARFRAYVDALAAPGAAPAGREAQLAHFINAYNALAIAGIVQGMSPSSLLGRTRYFRLARWPLDGRPITLYDLEHDVLLPLREPRIHFAIVCASRSCPRLRSEAYVPAALDAQLDDQARRFVNDPARNQFDAAARVARLSEIFKWYEDDFRGAAGGTQQYLARYVADPAVARDLAAGRYAVEWIPYDWSLNGVPPRP